MSAPCQPNRLNEQYASYLMPGEELHETPEGDTGEGHHFHPLIRLLSQRRSRSVYSHGRGR